MSDDDLEAVLRRVAAGELTPEDALRNLGAPAKPAPTGDEPVTAIRLKTSYRSVQVLTDPTVAQLHVLGEHSIRRSGGVLEVSTAGPLDDDERADDEARRTAGAGRVPFSDLPST